MANTNNFTAMQERSRIQFYISKEYTIQFIIDTCFLDMKSIRILITNFLLS